MAGVGQEVGRGQPPTTIYRSQRIGQLIRAKRGRLTLRDMLAIEHDVGWGQRSGGCFFERARAERHG